MVSFQHRTFFGPEPFGVGKTVAQQENRQRAQRNGRHPLQQEHPLPAGKATLARSKVTENPAGKRTANQAGDRNGTHEQRHDPTTAKGREPLRQIQHHTRKEAGFSRTGEKAQGIEPGRGGHKHQAGREQAPTDHHHGDPASRTKAGEGQVARHAAQHVADEENPGAKAVYRLAEFQRIEHL